MRYLARFGTSTATSYTMDIFLEEKEGVEFKKPLLDRLFINEAVLRELEVNNKIRKVEFFQFVGGREQ